MDCQERDLLNKGQGLIAGVDEAGRGPLAGPVVAAAVIFDDFPVGLPIRDSKTLTTKSREYLFEEIYRKALSIGIGIIDAEEIDNINILQASLKAMEEAVNGLSVRPHMLLIDGSNYLNLDLFQKTIIGGDAKSIIIGAASIIAKVTRDRIMEAYHRLFPGYGFLNHKGYGTRRHIDALKRLGPCPIHRRTFRGVV